MGVVCFPGRHTGVCALRVSFPRPKVLGAHLADSAGNLEMAYPGTPIPLRTHTRKFAPPPSQNAIAPLQSAETIYCLAQSEVV